MSQKSCSCLSGNPGEECCAPIIRGTVAAPTAERLMRSRFSSFVQMNSDHLLASWHPTTRPDSLQLDSHLHWYRLDIIRTSAGTPLDTNGTVEFEAFYRSGPDSGFQHEVSRFVRERGKWYYLDDEPAIDGDGWPD